MAVYCELSSSTSFANNGERSCRCLKGCNGDKLRDNKMTTVEVWPSGGVFIVIGRACAYVCRSSQ